MMSQITMNKAPKKNVNKMKKDSEVDSILNIIFIFILCKFFIADMGKIKMLRIHEIIKNFWEKIINIGITPELHEKDAKYVRLTNALICNRWNLALRFYHRY